jgi:hypothetical protein
LENNLLGRLWEWLIGKQKVDITLTVKIEDLDKLAKVLRQSSNHPVIINHEKTDSLTTQQVARTPIVGKSSAKRKLEDDPLDANEIASIMLADGIEKVTDKTGDNVISATQGASTDDTVSSLKKFRGGKKKDV